MNENSNYNFNFNIYVWLMCLLLGMMLWLMSGCATHKSMDVVSAHAVDSSRVVTQRHDSSRVVVADSATSVASHVHSVSSYANDSVRIDETITEDITTTTDSLGRCVRHEQRKTHRVTTGLRQASQQQNAVASQQSAVSHHTDATEVAALNIDSLLYRRKDTAATHELTGTAVAKKKSWWARVTDAVNDILCIAFFAVIVYLIFKFWPLIRSFLLKIIKWFKKMQQKK
jgi:hypothetical protein